MASASFPVPKFNFRVTFDPGGVISFQEVTGLVVENEFIEYRNGSDPFYTPERRVGLRKAGTVTFKKGIISGDTKLMDLYNDLHNKKGYYPTMPYPINVTVELLDESGSTVRTWKVWGAVPTKLEADNLSSADNSIALETMELAHSGIDIE
jgi:phage tail-like protein